MSKVKYPHITVRLVGEDGNAFAIMGRVSMAMRRAKVPPQEVKNFTEECMSRDYDHLLQTVMKWVNIS